MIRRLFSKAVGAVTKSNRFPVWLLAGLIMAPTTHANADTVKIGHTVEPNRLRVVFEWAKPVPLKAAVDDKPLVSVAMKKGRTVGVSSLKNASLWGRELYIQFGRGLQNPDLESLRKKTGNWIESVRNGYDTVLIRVQEPSSFGVFTDRNKVILEITKSFGSKKEKNVSVETSLLIKFAESALASKRPQLVNDILKKYGEDFLSTEPILAARLMLALKKESDALRWIHAASRRTNLTLDQQVDLLGLYGQLGKTAKMEGWLEKKKLLGHILRELESPNLPQARREELVYSLLNLKAYAAVLPYLRTLANFVGGDWADTYEDSLKKLGRKEEMVKFWVNRVKQPDLSAERRRGLAYQLLEANRKSIAVAVFQELAQSASAGSEDVKELLYLWGPRPGPGALKWIASRCEASTGAERAAWLKHLILSGGAKEAIRIVQKTGFSGETGDKVFYAYLKALEELRDGPAFAAAVRGRVKTENDPDRLSRYGKLAADLEQYEVAQVAYEKLLTLRPKDVESLRTLGLIASYANHQKKARVYFERYLSKKDGDWQVNYYFAEANFLEHRKSDAQKYYERALKKIDGGPRATFPQLMARANILHRLSKDEEAISAYEKLMEQHPGNKEIRVKFVSALMDLGQYNRAEKLLIRK